MARQWMITGQDGFEKSLEYQQDVKIPSQHELNPNQVLVKLYAASLNYRELMITTSGSVNGPLKGPVIAGCDGAGQVQALGSDVRDFKVGDRVVMYLAPDLANAHGDDAAPTLTDALAALGQGGHGTLRSWGVFDEKALVLGPTTVDWRQAGTLSCTWLTAWNVLFGSKGREVTPDSWVLVQGTGGVSMAALQLAVAARATVVATTSSPDRAARLTAFGASHVICRTAVQDWGQQARALTPGGRGFDFVIDVGGDETLPQSLLAVRTDGLVSVVGGVGGKASPVPMLAALTHACNVRGVFAGSRNQMAAVAKYIDAKLIKPAVDDVVFELGEAKAAYQRLHDKKHFSKVVIRIDH